MILSSSDIKGQKKQSHGYSSLIPPVLLILLIVVLTVPASGENPAVDPGVVTVFAVIPPYAQTDPHFQYQFGDTISLTGTNTGSRITYLFLTGPNLKANGSQIQSGYPASNQVVEGDVSTFATAVVDADGRWSYAWDTSKTTLAPGAYTIYVVSKPHDKSNLELTPYGTTSVIIGKVQPPSSFSQEKYIMEDTIVIAPAGPVTSGTPVTMTSVIDFMLTGTSTTFPMDHDLIFSTMLDNPQWSYTLVLDGVGNKRPAMPGTVLDLSGFELSYPGTVNEERLIVSLQGTAPVVRDGRTKNAVQISIVDTDGNVVPNSTVIREITVLPSPGTTPHETPTTAPIMPAVPTTQKGNLPLLIVLCGIAGACGVVQVIRNRK